MSDYHIAGDKTGKTYGVYKGSIFEKQELIKSGLKSIKECQKLIEELEKVKVKK